MWLALLVLAAAEWIPARWNTADVNSLEVLAKSPVNCVLLEEAQWSPEFLKAANARDIATLAVVHPSEQAAAQVRKATTLPFQGIVFEGDFSDQEQARLSDLAKDRKLTLIHLPRRDQIRFNTGAAVIGTYQGVWPGISPEGEQSAKAAPSGAAWIYTNSGFLRFTHALSSAQVWLGIKPPEKTIVTTERYIQSVGDAAMAGGKWILAFDAEFEKKLYARDAEALKEWARITGAIEHFYKTPQWQRAAPAGKLAIIQPIQAGALLSGSILDMITTKHTPVRAIPVEKLSSAATEGVKLAVNVDPNALSDEQKQELKDFLRRGGSVLNGPPGWRFPALKPGQITLDDSATKQVDEIWREINGLIYRRNLGVRMYNVATMLSSYLETPDEKQVVVHLVNYADYAVESIAVHFPVKMQNVMLHVPGKAPRKLELFDAEEEGSGVEVDLVESVATLTADKVEAKPAQKGSGK